MILILKTTGLRSNIKTIELPDEVVLDSDSPWIVARHSKGAELRFDTLNALFEEYLITQTYLSKYGTAEDEGRRNISPQEALELARTEPDRIYLDQVSVEELMEGLRQRALGGTKHG